LPSVMSEHPCEWIHILLIRDSIPGLDIDYSILLGVLATLPVDHSASIIVILLYALVGA